MDKAVFAAINARRMGPPANADKRAPAWHGR